MFRTLIFVLLIAAAVHPEVQADVFKDTFDTTNEETISVSMDSAFGKYRSDLGPLLKGPVEKKPETEVKIRCGNRESPDFTQTFRDDQSTWEKLDAKRPITFIVHGWLDNSENVWVQQTARELLKIRDSTVCMVDYRHRARYNYRQAVEEHVPHVADVITRMIQFANKRGVKLEQITLIGHNLGAHIVGQVGRKLDGRIGEIYGLDPNGPLFKCPVDRGLERRLDSTDAKYVQVIITSRKDLGLDVGEGHENFYPNGGLSAKNCPISDTTPQELTKRIACSQRQATEYFRRSLDVKNVFEGRQCSDYQQYLEHHCDTNESNVLGIHSRRVGGNFFLKAEPVLPK